MESLASQLELQLNMQVTEVLQQAQSQSDAFKQLRNNTRRRGMGPPNGRRGTRSSGRREFQKEILEKWPDLEDPAGWKDLPWLTGSEGESILEQMRKLPGFEIYNKNMEDRRIAREKTTAAELRTSNSGGWCIRWRVFCLRRTCREL